MHRIDWKHRIVRMSLAALVGAAALGVGTTAQRLYAGDPDCNDYACTTNKGCQGVKCDVCADTNDRCAKAAY